MGRVRDPRFDFSMEDIRSAMAAGRLLSMEMEFTRVCNYHCSYCYVSETHLRNELTPEECRSALKQAADLGARKIVILGGEPLVYSHLEEMLDFIESLGMVSEIFTNGSLVTPEAAAMLFRHRTRVIVKLNTLDPENHDRLTGFKGSLQKTWDAIRNLEEAGYAGLDHMLGASTIISTANLEEIPRMRVMLRERKLLPYFECITPQGRLLDHESLMPSADQLKAVFDELAEIDRRYGFEWEPQPPLAGDKCFRHQYSCVVQSNGVVVPCVGLDTPIGNIREKSLKEILSESLVLYHLKNYRKFIKGPCAACDKADHCYGCRGTAFQLTGDYLASDPTCWRNKDKQDQISFLPCTSDNMLPHARPMLFVDRLLKIGEKQAVTESVVRESNPFVDKASGRLAREAFVEYAAQTAALMDSFEKDGRVSPGLLIEVQNFQTSRDAKVNDRITVRLKKEFDMDIWHGVSVQIEVNGEFAAQGELKLCIFNTPVES